MKNLILTFLFLFSFASYSQEKPIVVVELFTSEGCSSCPSADQLLSKMIKNASDDVEIYGLSFHVDYWDYLGWKDPYAHSDFTARQRVYGKKFRNNSIYTPQMVVNGRYEFVGSDERKLKQVVHTEKDMKFKTQITVSRLELKDQQLKFTIHSTTIDRLLLNVAVVEQQLAQQVTRGENRGRTLNHDNVVRAYDSRQFNGKANTFTLPLPSDLDFNKSSLIVYTQEEATWQINATKKIDFKTLK